MLDIKEIKEGLEQLGITDQETIQSILNAREENEIFFAQEVERKQREYEFKNRFVIPQGHKKKFYTNLGKETTQKINDLKDHVRRNPDSPIIPFELEDYIEKNKKIKSILKFHGKLGNNKGNLEKAKLYPINQLIEFNSAGFSKCLWHAERTGSLKYYHKSNSVYCFSCAQKHDALDVAMKLYNLTLPEAVKRLST